MLRSATGHYGLRVHHHEEPHYCRPWGANTSLRRFTMLAWFITLCQQRGDYTTVGEGVIMLEKRQLGSGAWEGCLRAEGGWAGGGGSLEAQGSRREGAAGMGTGPASFRGPRRASDSRHCARSGPLFPLPSVKSREREAVATGDWLRNPMESGRRPGGGQLNQMAAQDGLKENGEGDSSTPA